MYAIVQILDMKEITSTIHVKVPVSVHHVARLRAVERRQALREYIISLILDDVSRQQQKLEVPSDLGSDNA